MPTSEFALLNSRNTMISQASFITGGASSGLSSHSEHFNNAPAQGLVLSSSTAGVLSLTGYHLTFDWEGNDFNSSPVPGRAKWTTTLSAYPNSQGLRTLGNGDQEVLDRPVNRQQPVQTRQWRA